MLKDFSHTVNSLDYGIIIYICIPFRHSERILVNSKKMMEKVENDCKVNELAATEVHMPSCLCYHKYKILNLHECSVTSKSL